MSKNKTHKKGIVKKIILITFVTVSIIAGGIFLYSKIQNEEQDLNPITAVKNYHEKSDNYKNLILDASRDLMVKKNHKLKEISFNNNSDGSLSIFTKVDNQINRFNRFFEYRIPNVETTNLEEIIEIVNNYDFKDNVVENICFKDSEYAQTLARDKFLGNYKSPRLDETLNGWEKVDEFGGYYRFEYDENGKCQKAIIGGFIIASKDKEQKAIRFEYSLDLSNVDKYHDQYVQQYIRRGGQNITEELVQEMSPNFLKSQYLGSETYVDQFTGDYDNSLNN